MIHAQGVNPNNLPPEGIMGDLAFWNRVDLLLSMLPVFSLATFRAELGLQAQVVYITDNAARGMFYRDTTDTTTADDGVFCLVNTDTNVRYKRNTSDELTFTNAFRNRKVVMWQVTGNDHQFIGLGANSGEFRLQVDGTATDYNWYAGTSPALSGLLMRLMGTGKLLLGTGALTNTNAQAEVAGTNANDGVLLVLTNKHATTGRKGAQIQFHSSGIAMWRIGLAAGDDQAGDAFVFRGWSNGAFPELIRITATGSIGIGTDNPQEKLHVMGRVRIAGIVAGGSTSPGIVARPGLGTGATASISGADMAGLISLTAGSGTGVNAEVCKVTFATPYSAAPKVVMLDARSKNGRYQLGRLFVSAITATDFTISTTDSALDAGTANIDIQYVVIA